MGGLSADVRGVDPDGPVRTQEGGAITSVEAFVLGVMAAIVVGIGIPSYLAMQDRSHDSTARGHVRRAAEAVEDYRAEKSTLEGITPLALRRYDPGLEASTYRLQVTGLRSYCLESSAGGREWHVDGPGDVVSPGGCP